MKKLSILVVLLWLLGIVNWIYYREGWCGCLVGETNCSCESYWNWDYNQEDEEYIINDVKDFFKYINMLIKKYKK